MPQLVWGDHLQCHKWSGGTSCSYHKWSGGTNFGGTSCSMTALTLNQFIHDLHYHYHCPIHLRWLVSSLSGRKFSRTGLPSDNFLFGGGVRMLQSSSFLSQPFHPNVANSIIATCDGNLHPVASCGLMNVKQIPRHRIL